MNTLDNNELLNRLGEGEDTDLEFKSAKGGVPKGLWESYSALANTNGGYIVLGVNDNGSIEGLSNLKKIKKSLWDCLNDRGKISQNLLNTDDVIEESTGSGAILVLRIPRATRHQRPVYIGQNPLRGTYRRNYEGDYRCSEQDVGRMLADRAEEPKDSQILEGFSLEEDLDSSSVQQYRNRFSSRSPSHSWLSENDLELLKKLGGWKRNRQTGKEGLTLAGLMMFGKAEAIQEAVPEYNLDYREYLTSDLRERWSDRLTLDGTWEGNLFQFFQKVILRLSADLKLPFLLDLKLIRRGESPVHIAIREALVNTLIHADYTGQGGIVIEKNPAEFRFTNPGTLLISMDQFIEGGVSECRNKSLQKMFFMIGAAEKAGSGWDKIRQGWASQHWRSPRIGETVQPDRVKIFLPTISMIPKESLERLRQRFGLEFEQLNQTEVSVLATADLEGEVSNIRMRQISKEHRSDLTILLRGLVSKGLLEQEGQGRWTIYHLPQSHFDPQLDFLDSPKDIVDSSKDIVDSSKDIVDSPKDIVDSPKDIVDSPKDIVDSVDNQQELDKTKTEESVLWKGIPFDKVKTLADLAKVGRSRISAQEMKQLILKLCREDFLTKSQLAELLDKNSNHIYRHYLKVLVEEGSLRLKYPDSLKRPGQAYKTVENQNNS
jgi:ATP-dependent DNA helicase RecG